METIYNACEPYYSNNLIKSTWQTLSPFLRPKQKFERKRKLKMKESVGDPHVPMCHVKQKWDYSKQEPHVQGIQWPDFQI